MAGQYGVIELLPFIARTTRLCFPGPCVPDPFTVDEAAHLIIVPLEIGAAGALALHCGCVGVGVVDVGTVGLALPVGTIPVEVVLARAGQGCGK